MFLRIVHWLFNALPSIAGLLLATLSFALVFVKEADEWLRNRKWLRIFLASALAIVGFLAAYSDIKQRGDADLAHEKEAEKQGQDMDGLKAQLQRSELSRVSDTQFLKGQLSVFAQFAPAIFKLAQATENNTRLQYEAKKITNQQLFDMTMDVAKQLRALHTKYHEAEQKQWEAEAKAANAARASRTPYQPDNNRMAFLWSAEQSELGAIMPDAIFSRNEMLRLKIPEPPLGGAGAGPRPTSVINAIFLGGGGFGTGNEDMIATYLELMAKKIPLSGK